MVQKYLKVVFFGITLFLVSYLSIAALWANTVVEELLQSAPSAHQKVEIQPQHLKALVKIEDPTFYDHHGLSISNGQGLTTITSVVARDLFLYQQDLVEFKGLFQSFYKAVFSCCKKIDIGRDIMAVVLNSHSTKQQQLNLFINNTYWGSIEGNGVIGMEAAAMAYYGKETSQLTDNEFYGLIAMPIAPNYYHPVSNPEVHAKRVERIKAIVSGQCAASGWFDLTYKHCATGA